MSTPASLQSKYFWYAKRAIRRLGLLGGLGIGIAIIGLIAYYSAILPQKREVQALKNETEKLKSNTEASKLARINSPSTQTQLARFYQRFPSTTAAPDLLDKIYATAKTHGLSLEQGDYRWVHEDQDKLMRFEVVLPVKGSYIQVRKFVNQLMLDLPNLAVDDISFQRQRVGDAVVQSQIKFSLFLGEGK